MRARMWGWNMPSSRCAALFGLTGLLGCQLQVPGSLLDKVPAPEIMRLSIRGVAGTVSADTITVTLTANWGPVDLGALALTFEANNAKVFISGIRQISGSTLNDFSTSRIVTVVSADGSEKNYNLTVTPLTLFPFADTGQTQCYDATAAQTCATVTATHPRQDAEIADVPAARSFTGPTQHPVYTNDYTTTDNVTGLVWKTCSEGLSDASCATGTITTTTWNAAASLPACDALNSANSGSGYAGLKTWRMPNVEELQTLANYSSAVTAIDAAYFPGTATTNIYWASTTNTATPTEGWSVRFNLGTVYTYPKTSGGHVRCVSGKPVAKIATYAENGNGTVTDVSTKLVWQKCSRGQVNDSSCSGSATAANWAAALSYCQTLPLAGYNWRLPSVSEMNSLIDRTTANPAIQGTYFPATATGNYWTSTTDPSTPASAWFYVFAQGRVQSAAKTFSYNVRCVATGS